MKFSLIYPAEKSFAPTGGRTRHQRYQNARVYVHPNPSEQLFTGGALSENYVVKSSKAFRFPHRNKERGRLSSDLGGGAELTAALGTSQDSLTVLVKLELGDDDVGGVEAQGDGLAGGLVAGDTLDVDHVLEAVDGGDLALTALVRAADDGDLVVLTDGDGADL